MILRVAMVGCGYFGQFHLNAWSRIKAIDVVGVVEPSDDRRQTLQEAYPDVPFYNNLDDLLAEHQPDILDVATPPHTHALLIRPLLGKIRTIICQKPFCGNLQEAETLTREAVTGGSTLVIHENFRFMPWYRTIKHLIENDALGAVVQAQFRLRPGDGNGEDAYLDRQPYFRNMQRFLVHETGIHWIDTFRYLFGEPESIYADIWRANPAIKGEDAGLLVFTFGDGIRALFDANRTLDHAAENHRLTMGEFIVEGTKATLLLDGFGNLKLRQRNAIEMSLVTYQFADIDFGGDCVYQFQKHVVDHVVDGTKLETEALDYLTNIRIEEQVYAAAAAGKRLSLS